MSTVTYWLTQAQLDEDDWQEKESLRAEIRRLRTMVAWTLRKHADGWADFVSDAPSDAPYIPRALRAARLLNHWATAIDAGRL